VQVAGHELGHATHRVVDPADPPRDLSGWAWGVFVSLGLMALLSVLRLASAMSLRSTVTGGGDIVAKYDAYSRWTGFQAVLLLIAAGVFIAWFFQAYKNMRRLGVQDMRYGNGWAIGSWFVPILSLVRPKQMANDIWRGSERGTDVNSGWKSVPVPSLVHWWWALFLIQGLVLYYGQTTIESGYHDLFTFNELSHGVSQVKDGTTAEILGNIASIVGVVLAILFVSRVTERFDEVGADAFAQVGQAPQYAQHPPPPYPPPTAQHQSYPPPAPQFAQSHLQPAAPPPPPPTEQRVQCPECAEWIQAQANVCRFCGHRLRPLGQ